MSYEIGCVNHIEKEEDIHICFAGHCLSRCSVKCEGYKSLSDAANEEWERRQKNGINYPD